MNKMPQVRRCYIRQMARLDPGKGLGRMNIEDRWHYVATAGLADVSSESDAGVAAAARNC